MPNWWNMGWRGTSLWRFYLKKQLHYLEIDLSQSCLKKMLANEQIVHDVCNNVWWARQYNLLLYYGHLIWQQVRKNPDITDLFYVNYCPNCVKLTFLPLQPYLFAFFTYFSFLYFSHTRAVMLNALCVGLFKLNSVFLSWLFTDVLHIEVYKEVICCLSQMRYLWILTKLTMVSITLNIDSSLRLS